MPTNTRILVQRLYEHIQLGQCTLRSARSMALALPCIKASQAHQDFISHQCEQFDQFCNTVSVHLQTLVSRQRRPFLLKNHSRNRRSVLDQYKHLDWRSLENTQVWLYCSWSSAEHLERWAYGLALPFCTNMHSSGESPAHPLYVRNENTFGHLYMGFVGDCDPHTSLCRLYHRSNYIAKNFTDYAEDMLDLPDLDIATIIATRSNEVVRILSSRLLLQCEKESQPPPRYDDMGRNLIYPSDSLSLMCFLKKTGTDLA